MKDIFEAYISGDELLNAFLPYKIEDLFSSVESAKSDLPSDIVEVINAYQPQIGGSAVLPKDATTIVTGQQIGLFVGPLYCLYKAISAIKLAEYLSKRHGKSFAPVFWVASTDHDIDEVGTAYFLSKTNKIFAADFPDKERVAGIPLNKLPLSAALHDVIDEVAGETPGCVDKNEIVDFLHKSLDQSKSLSEWATRLLARLFRGTPLVFFEPTLEPIRDRARAIFSVELGSPTRLAQLVNSAGKKLNQKGFRVQVAKKEVDCSFFLEVEGKRRKVIYQDDRFVLPEENRTLSREEMDRILANSPERFSENVILRPVLQQYLLDPFAYVAGPGELAYWAQLASVFELYGYRMPFLYPRARFILTTIKHKKLLEKNGLVIADLLESAERIFEKAFHHWGEDKDIKGFRDHREVFEKAIAKFLQFCGQYGAELTHMSEALERQVKDFLDKMEKTLFVRNRNRVETLQQQIDRLQTYFYPNRKPQERVYSIFSFLFQYGWDLIPILLEKINVKQFTICEVEL